MDRELAHVAMSGVAGGMLGVLCTKWLSAALDLGPCTEWESPAQARMVIGRGDTDAIHQRGTIQGVPTAHR